MRCSPLSPSSDRILESKRLAPVRIHGNAERGGWSQRGEGQYAAPATENSSSVECFLIITELVWRVWFGGTYQWIRPADWVVIDCRRGCGAIAMERPQSEVFWWWGRGLERTWLTKTHLDCVLEPNMPRSYRCLLGYLNLNPYECLTGKSWSCEIMSGIL